MQNAEPTLQSWWSVYPEPASPAFLITLYRPYPPISAHKPTRGEGVKVALDGAKVGGMICRGQLSPGLSQFSQFAALAA